VGWATAWIGCKGGGAIGAEVGLHASPVGGAIGGFAGCIVGGIGGYGVGNSIVGGVYDWAEDTMFVPLPEIPSQ
jgi:hypothetical protein